MTVTDRAGSAVGRTGPPQTRVLPPRAGRFLLGLTGLVGFGLSLEVLARTGVVPARYLPPTSRILAALADSAAGGTLWSAVGNTVLTCDLVVEPRPGWAPIAGDKLAETKVPMPGPSRAEIDPLRLSPWEVMRDQVWNPPRDQLRAKVRVDIGYALGKMDVSKIGGTRRPGG